MEKRIPKKTYRNIMNSLGGGTVPREGLGYIAVIRFFVIQKLYKTEVQPFALSLAIMAVEKHFCYKQ